MGYGLVDLLHRRGELLAGYAVVPAELLLEVVHVALEVRDVDVLRPNERQLPPDVQGLPGGVPDEGDDGDEELRTDDVHLVIPI